ncbi:tRNA 2-thiouridine(34) synthase MnmA [Snodgrassella alvi]|jgi:tRNA-uridine 2-sulfurtransferase|uniref:tRNA-specific 2-thiouridylase MnmA n=1 Tax=Snodgrassella alvi TaxID=1196083 RepID=A0A2N9XHJ7_9NEIS|nr:MULTISPECIES: tRNA 2-thiouridine(34) synthase MnmA [Snodgrassella]MCO6506081.1 tRNA 2-thiouridine(34) synthase MnmA [Snodgrassella sp.]MCO6517632.1 tRNA 2-thiouridine(34) synthase MnmA [Snodgrassella sp.]PIT47802.1 tRNA 2-thiouridine(34) synthase MnmA [Snodgrassella alvi]
MNIKANLSQRIVVGMSGGVDSSVTAWLLRQGGYDVRGVFMQNWEDDNDDEYCSIKQDSLDAVAVADLIGMDIDIVNFAGQYKDNVFAYFLQEYQAGRTPNPDVLCNAEIKFKCFLEYALAGGADLIATGHYARKDVRDGVHYLLKGLDQNKDQSYFLYRLQPYQLQRALFPLGELEKSQVRLLAEQAQLPTAKKKDSTGICFIGERPFRQFLQRYLPTNPGAMVTPEGKVVGEHEGLMYYTLGQRKGLGIGGDGEPWFVAGKNLPRNELVVVQGHDHPLLFSHSLIMHDLSFTTLQRPAEGRYGVKTRYRMPDAQATLRYLDDDCAELVFDQPQWAVTPGQSAVLYAGEVCLGGGIINDTDSHSIYNN